jgi:hypothetical protein
MKAFVFFVSFWPELDNLTNLLNHHARPPLLSLRIFDVQKGKTHVAGFSVFEFEPTDPGIRVEVFRLEHGNKILAAKAGRMPLRLYVMCILGASFLIHTASASLIWKCRVSINTPVD